MGGGKQNTSGTAGKAAAFLEALPARGGNITAACEASGLSRSMVYRLEAENAEFAAAFREAQRRGLEALEDEARRRAFEGTVKPVFYQGEQCGETREYSTTLMIFLLKGGMPDKYRDNMKVEHSGTVNLADELNEARKRAGS